MFIKEKKNLRKILYTKSTKLSTIMQLKYNYYYQQAMTESQQQLHNQEKKREKSKGEEERE